MGVLVRELAALYGAFAAGPAVAAAGAAGAVRRLRRLAARAGCSGEVLERAARLLAAASWPALPPLLELPTDRPRPAVQSFRGAARPVRPAAGLVARRCAALGRREGATLFMALLAGLPGAAAPLQRARTTWWSARRSPAATARRSRG